MKKCCYCFELTQGVRSIGIFLFLLTTGLFASYLVFIENIRHNVFEKFYDIIPCSKPWIDMVIDSLFEYSILVNVLLILLCKGCTRWLLMPWLIMYFINILVFLKLSIFLFIKPPPLLPEGRSEFPMLRSLGLVPLVIAWILGYFWYVVQSLFSQMGSPEKPDEDPCCPMQLKTGVQIIGGILAIIHAIILVAHYAKLDDLLADKYERIMGEQPSAMLQVGVSTTIVLGILANLFVILGGTGKRWRRSLLVPWLIMYGIGIMAAIVAHQWFTTLCWVEEKIYGLICLVVGFLSLVVWTLVWIVAAEAADKPKTLISRNPLGFQRL